MRNDGNGRHYNSVGCDGFGGFRCHSTIDGRAAFSGQQKRLLEQQEKSSYFAIEKESADGTLVTNKNPRRDRKKKRGEKEKGFGTGIEMVVSVGLLLFLLNCSY